MTVGAASEDVALVKYAYLDRAYRQVGQALTAGKHERLGAISHRADYSGRCMSPVTFEAVARSEQDVRWVSDVDETIRPDAPIYLDTVVACRRCEACLRRRAFLWKTKAEAEFLRAGRTWFGTLTCTPHNHFQNRLKTDIRLAARAIDVETLKEHEYFREVCRTLGVELQKTFKRLRHNTKSSIRYVAVFERHRNGDPHIHILLHEPLTGDGVTKRELEREWHLGLQKWRLAQTRGVCGYIMKYLTKDFAARIRASQHYGSTDREVETVNAPPPVIAGRSSSVKVNDPKTRELASLSLPVHQQG